MNKLDALQKYFPTGTTEGERQLLDKCFVTPDQLPDVLAISSGSPRILVGNKGVGKSAILEWLFSAAKKRRIPSLYLRPDDLDLAPLAGASDVGTIKRVMYECFLDAVANAIGQRLSGFLLGNAKVLYEKSVASGARESDWMAKLLKVLSALSKPVTQIDAAKLAGDLSRQNVSKKQLESVISSYTLQEDSVFLILFDDTDQVASPDDSNHLNRIWGLLLAIRKLTSTSPNVKCVVSLRTEVWMRLLRNDSGQRDQIDHFRPLTLTLRAPEEHLKAIFRRRLRFAAEDSGSSKGSPMMHFFDDEWMNLPGSTERRSWDQFLLKSSRERPRDMVQLVGHLASSAKNRGSERISSIDAATAMDTYSKERAEDLAIEMGFDCPSFLDVLRSFVDLDFEVDFEDLRAHLRKIPSRFSLIIHKRTVSPDSDEGAVQILSLLHESGFINPRVADSRQSENYRHITFLDDPHMIQMSRWNELQGARWEVHPAFRTYLLGLKKEASWRH